MSTIWTSILIAATINAVVVLIEVLQGADVRRLRPIFTLGALLFFLTSTVGTSVSTVLAQAFTVDIPSVTDELLPFVNAFFGVFLFKALLGRVSVEVYGANVLTISKWMDKAKDLAIEHAQDKELWLRNEREQEYAQKLSQLGGATLNTLVSRYLPESVAHYEDQATADNADVILYKSMELASVLPESTLSAIIKRYKEQDI